MLEKAKEKIKREMAELNSPYSKILGEYILNSLLTSEQNAQMVLAEDKTLKKCVDAITKKARGQRVGNCAVVEDKTVYKWLREYYGIEAEAAGGTAGAVKTEDTLNVSLLDLLSAGSALRGDNCEK